MQAVQLARRSDRRRRSSTRWTPASCAAAARSRARPACQFGHLMEGARAAIRPRRSRPRRAASGSRTACVLPHHAVLIALTVAARRRAAPAPRPLAGSGSRRSRCRSLRDSARTADADPDAFLFTGCVMDAWQRDVHRAALTVMRAAGARPGLPGPGGGLLRRAPPPRRPRRRGAASRPRASSPRCPADGAVVVDSAGCGAAMKDYGRLLDTDAARAFSARVVDFSEWLAGPRPRHRCGRPARQWSSRTRATCATSSTPRARCARCCATATSSSSSTTTGCAAARAARTASPSPTLSGAVRDRKVAAIRAAAARTGRSSSRPRTRGARCTSPPPGSTSVIRAELVEEALVMTGAEELADQLRSIEEQLRDLAYDRAARGRRRRRGGQGRREEAPAGPAGDREGHPRPRHHRPDSPTTAPDPARTPILALASPTLFGGGARRRRRQGAERRRRQASR